MRSELFDSIENNPLFVSFWRKELYYLYDYLIWSRSSMQIKPYYYSDHQLIFNLSKIFINWFEKDFAIIKMTNLANKIRASKWLDDYDIYTFFEHMDCEQILESQKFELLNLQEINLVIDYLYCKMYPDSENLSVNLKSKVDKLMNLRIIWQKLKEIREYNLNWAIRRSAKK